MVRAEIVVVVVLFALMFGLMRLLRGTSDRRRIEEYLARLGGRLEQMAWTPFARGASPGQRTYRIIYADSTGLQREATCKTSGWTGVFMREEGTSASPASYGFPMAGMAGQTETPPEI